MLKYIFYFITISLFLSSCNTKDDYLTKALKESADNRHELETVLNHFRSDPEKLAAARFLIENMPGHYSYKSDRINDYYAIGEEIFKSKLSPVAQRDTLLKISENQFDFLEYDTIQDVKIITADYLIKNIDDAFKLWRNKPWLSHLDFNQFCEYVLPYKCYELQSLDYWRDTLQMKFGDALSGWIPNDDTYSSPFNAARAVRGRIARDVRPYGVQMGKGYSFGAANNMYKITYGECTDYVRLAICVLRSLGLPAMYNYTPQWGRYRAGHDWYTILNDKGELLSSEWDISSDIASVFFPYQRIPKVFRYTYAINRDVEKYLNDAIWQYPFSVFQKDVTDEHFATSDLEIPVSLNTDRISDKYAYLGIFNGCSIDWDILTFGEIKDEKGNVLKTKNNKVYVPKRNKLTAYFPKTGRNVLYIVLQYDENGWFPISQPFILHSNGNIEYIYAQNNETRKVTIRRKYFSSQNVVEMQRRVLGGKIQVSSDHKFTRDTCTVLTITDLNYPDRIPLSLPEEKEFRYARYLSPTGSYGSIAELAFFADTTELVGKTIGSTEDNNILLRAFDDDYLTNFETDKPDNNWVGMDFLSSKVITHVRIVPRNDDNYVRPNDEYQLLYWDNTKWISTGLIKATDNKLIYDNIPKGALMWLRNLTRGMDERCFLINSKEDVEWW